MSHSFFYSHLTYGILAWGCSSKSKISRINILQKKALRAIANASYLSHTEPIAKNLKILKLNQVTCLYMGKFMQRVTTNTLSKALLTLFPNKQVSYNTRQDNNINFQIRNTTLSTNSFLHSVIKNWLQIPKEICKIQNKKTFVNKFYNYLLTN